MDRAEKQQEISYLTGCFEKAQIAVCADYRGLTVAEITNLRRELKKNGAFGRVVKNTLAKLSAQAVFKDDLKTEVEKFVDLMEGPSLLVFSFQDPVAPTKVLAQFLKTNDKLKIKGAFLDGQFVDTTGVDTISKLPGREEILASLLNLMNAPATSLLRLMKEPSSQVVRVIDAQRQKIAGPEEVTA